MALSLSPAALFLAVFRPKERVVCVHLNAHIRTHTLAGHTITARTQPYIFFFAFYAAQRRL